MSRIKLADRFSVLRERLGERLAERPPQTLELPERRLRRATRRDFLLLGAGAAAAAAGLWWLQPDRASNLFLPERSNHALDTVAARLGLGRERRERFLDRALTLDDDVAEALYSPNRQVRTYSKSQ